MTENFKMPWQRILLLERQVEELRAEINELKRPVTSRIFRVAGRAMEVSRYFKTRITPGGKA